MEAAAEAQRPGSAGERQRLPRRRLDGTGGQSAGPNASPAAAAAALMDPTGRRLAGLLPLLLGLLLALAPVRTGHPLGNSSRHRRGILQLAGVIRCTTGRTALAYIRYGCYCGWGGRGWPRDQVDWCCFKHDCCYGKAEEGSCAPKMQRYAWECKDSEAKCDNIEDKCQKMACECDRDAAKCLAKATYNMTYLFWPDTLCGQRTPKCHDD